MEIKNNYIGLNTSTSNVTVTHATFKEGLLAVMSSQNHQMTSKDCTIDNNTLSGFLDVLSNSIVIDDCSINNNEQGTMTLESQHLVIKNSTITNNTLGLRAVNSYDLLITGNLFNRNGLSNDEYFCGAIIMEGSNCRFTSTMYAPPSTVLHLNSTFQAGAKAYSNDRMIEGNYGLTPIAQILAEHVLALRQMVLPIHF
ncbi:MAG: right-handed parallel beta-helix repeat-containing protein [Crenarchaeota archaeon]|nr:right-handed parallel beta-helix repeat-containing protein [Thermoproteota archaeon]